MVEREVELTYAELLELPAIERDITLTCVSNVVGGQYVGSARWIGVPLATILELAGVRAGADQIVSTSVGRLHRRHPDRGRHRRPRRDAGVRDERRAAAGRPRLPGPDGRARPVRLRVGDQVARGPGADHLRRLRRRTGSSVAGPPRRRSRRCPGSTRRSRSPGSRRAGSRSPAWPGRSTAASSGSRSGSTAAPGTTARLAAVGSIDTWRQWVYEWDAAPGQHTPRQVRATDGDGLIQTDVRPEPFPSGATGWHTVVVTVA